MALLDGLQIPNDKFDKLPRLDLIRRWSYEPKIFSIDLMYLHYLKETKFTRSNDLLYAYCTEYNLVDVVRQMDPNSPAFSAFKQQMSPLLESFFNDCTRVRIQGILSFYDKLLNKLTDPIKGSNLFGSKQLELTMKAFSKTLTDREITSGLDNVYLTLKNFLKVQLEATDVMLSSDTIQEFLNKVKEAIMKGNEGLTDDAVRRKVCKALEVLAMFLVYSRRFKDAKETKEDTRDCRWTQVFSNIALFAPDVQWKDIFYTDGVKEAVTVGVPYLHVDMDAAICIFPETTDYPLLKEDFTKQNRSPNQNSAHLIQDWLVRRFIVIQGFEKSERPTEI